MKLEAVRALAAILALGAGAMAGCGRRPAGYENSLGMRFVPIPGTPACFSIWDTRVRDFSAFVRDTGYDADAGMFSIDAEGKWHQVGGTWRNPGFAQTEDCPVVGVSWYDAEAFCRWLTARERAQGRIPAGQRYRLPTDAEWSLAIGLAREDGASPKEKNCRIPGAHQWGPQWPPPADSGNFADATARRQFPHWKTIAGYDDGYVYTSPVGRFPPNRFGLYDMAGNVWQWCQDEYDPGRGARGLRGGAFGSRDDNHLWSSYRDPDRPGPGLRHSDLGFRCVLAPDGGN